MKKRDWAQLLEGMDYFYDIGVGLKSKGEALVAKKAWPNIECFGCEPSSKRFSSALEWFPGTVLNVGLGVPGKYPIYSKKGQSFMIETPEATLEEEISCISLDSFDRLAGKPQNIFLWMDIEGKELEALESGQELLSSGRVKYMNLEVSITARPEGWTKQKALGSFLRGFGYKSLFVRAFYGTHKDVIFKLTE